MKISSEITFSPRSERNNRQLVVLMVEGHDRHTLVSEVQNKVHPPTCRNSRSDTVSSYLFVAGTINTSYGKKTSKRETKTSAES